MARPTWNDIESEEQSWDADIQDNFENLSDRPWPVYEHAGDESDLASTFTANLYDRCMVMVNHTTLGWSIYFSDGTNWVRTGVLGATAVVALTDNSGGTADDTIAVITQGANAGSADIAPTQDAIADLAAKVNELRQILVDNGLAS